MGQLRMELLTMTKVDSINVTKIEEFIKMANIYVIVIELANGGSLLDFLNSRSLEE